MTYHMVMPKKRADATALVFIIGATKELNEVFFFDKVPSLTVMPEF